jgi:hypothetical protein
MAQVAECLTSKCEILSSNFNTIKKKKKKEKKKTNATLSLSFLGSNSLLDLSGYMST